MSNIGIRNLIPASTAVLLMLILMAGTGCREKLVAIKDTVTPSRINKAQEDKKATSKSVMGILKEGSPMKVRWAVDLKNRKVVKFWMPPESEDINYVLLLTNTNELVAIHKRSGEAVWWTRLSAPPTDTPYFSKFAIYIVIKSNLLCLERHSGEVVWHLPLPFAPGSGPTVQEITRGKPIIYLPGLDRRVYAIEVKQTVWPPKYGAGKLTRQDMAIDKYIVRIAWRYPAHAQIAGTMVFHGNQVYLADNKYYVYGISTNELKGGKPKEPNKFRTQGPMEAGPTVLGMNLYVTSHDRSLYCLSKRDLSEIWSYPSGYTLDQPAYGMLDKYTSTTAVVLKCGKKGPLVGLIDGDEPKDPLWTLPDAEEVVGKLIDLENPVEKRTIMLIRNKDKTISANFFCDGSQLWRMPAGMFGPYCQNTRDDLIYTASGSGGIVCALEKTR